MGSKKRKYDSQFKQSAVELVTKQGYQPEQAALSLGLPLATLKYWLRSHVDRQGVMDPVHEGDLRRRVEQLERENAQLRMEREILKKATAFFAKEPS